MTLDAFGRLLADVDPSARRYATMERGSFTTWAEYARITAYADGRNQGGWKVQVDRYTQVENDAIATAIENALEVRDDVSFSHEVDYDPDTRTIRHLFDCEVW